MDVFKLRDRLIADYRNYTLSFVQIRNERILAEVTNAIDSGSLWPEPLIQMNPAFESGGSVDDLVQRGTLAPLCAQVFRKDKHLGAGSPLRLHKHQVEAIEAARRDANYVLTTGTGSGKSLSYIVPIVDYVLRRGSGRGIQAIVVYPMNALANSQVQELEKFLGHGFGKKPVTFARYTGQEDDAARDAIKRNPPDILLTNFVMLEYLLTRPFERELIEAARGLRFLVLDELHTYRGRQGADVALLARRVRDRLSKGDMLCVGTSATMSSKGTFAERQAEVAKVASRLFGAAVEPGNVIGESLRRSTPEPRADAAFADSLSHQVQLGAAGAPKSHAALIQDPLAAWLESTFGVVPEAGTGRLVRQKPRGIRGAGGAAEELASRTKLSQKECEDAIVCWLLAGYQCIHPDTGLPSFAFRLHQFISPGNQVFATIESENKRHITLNEQRYVPGDRSRALMPVVFCRECGQEYYTVRRVMKDDGSGAYFEKRELSDHATAPGYEAGLLYVSADNPWPEAESAQIDVLPDDWIEEHNGTPRIHAGRRGDVPKATNVRADGVLSADGQRAWFLPAPFRFCLRCAVAYDTTQRSDFAKLYSLGFEGRSTATTILSLTAVRTLRETPTLGPEARKLLSFTDNRQDASLQAGHFNDFVSIGLIRAALFTALEQAGEGGLDYAVIPQRVFDALHLDLAHYAIDPTVRFAAKAETERALREVLEYRIYQDLQRGWRVTAPNLEQSGLLRIDYNSLGDLCHANEEWILAHTALATASPETRETICKTLLDFLRRSLAIRVACLDPEAQEQIKSRSRQKLLELWGLDDGERLEVGRVAFPRGRRNKDWRTGLYLSGRGSFGRYLRRSTTFAGAVPRPSVAETDEIIADLFRVLRVAGLVEVTHKGQDPTQVDGYQIPASAMTWKAGNGQTAFHDPIRVATPPKDGPRTNPYFVEHYKKNALGTAGFEAREHTAQVPPKERELREERFRSASLPVLYCSPTMELGVDIRDLNVVNMRNVPPTPANYAQRSGRAGRSGQPALVFTYCSRGNSHDQYFFKRAERMVAGVVEAPRLDLVNEDLVRSHVQAVWIAETGMALGSSLVELLEVEGNQPTLVLRPSISAALQDQNARRRGRERAEAVLATIAKDLESSGWYSSEWLEKQVFAKLTQRFEDACGRWRSLYRSASRTRDLQHAIIQDAGKSPEAHDTAKRLRKEAEAQLELLRDTKSAGQSDFYSYRYFASEGFLPGYNFPRLPLSAFIPGRKDRDGRDDFLSRPRFLAINEFGPRAIVYHEGARYVINKVILPLDEDGTSPLETAKICGSCGYYHPQGANGGTDICEHCAAALGAPVRQLFRMQNVVAKRRDRISSDEEERLRLGYEIQTTVRFQQVQERLLCVKGEVRAGYDVLGSIVYGHAADLWRINYGWMRRAKDSPNGFDLDMERGFWGKKDDEEADGDPMSPKTQRVVPYVRDRRNALLFTLADPLSHAGMASLQASIKKAIQATFQLEDSELAAEALPTPDIRNVLLFYEATEGGAGVLRRLVDEPQALASVARQALELCHYDPATGADLRRAPLSKEDCEAGCYDCLMSYSNQRDHRDLDRKLIRDFLMSLAQAIVYVTPGMQSFGDHVADLKRRAGSNLEREWIDYVCERGYRLPSDGQQSIPAANTKPDFIYQDDYAVVYVDGPPHDYPERQRRDADQQRTLGDQGYTVVRFHHADDWDTVFKKYPSLFRTHPEGPGPR